MIQDVVSFSDSLCSGKCVRCRIILPLYYFLVSVCQSLLCLLVWSWLFAVTHGRLADCGGARGRCCVVALSAARGRARRGPASRPAEAVGSPWPSPRASSSTDTPPRLCWTGRFALPWAVRSAPPSCPNSFFHPAHPYNFLLNTAAAEAASAGTGIASRLLLSTGAGTGTTC